MVDVQFGLAKLIDVDTKIRISCKFEVRMNFRPSPLDFSTAVAVMDQAEAMCRPELDVYKRGTVALCDQHHQQQALVRQPQQTLKLTPSNMRFSTFLSAFAALGAVIAAPADDSGDAGLEARALSEPQLLQLYHLPNMRGQVFTGVGRPCRCSNLPRNINDFGSGSAAPGFRCTIYTDQNCRGSTLTVGGAQAALQTLRTPAWRSWRCVCADC